MDEKYHKIDNAFAEYRRVYVRSYETDVQYVWLSLLVPAFLGLLIWMGAAGVVTFNVEEQRFLKYAMSVAVNMSLSAAAVMLCQFPAECSEKVTDKTFQLLPEPFAWFSRRLEHPPTKENKLWSWFGWPYIYFTIVRKSGVPTFVLKLVFDFKGFADMLVSLVYTLFGEFVAFDDTTMSEAVWWHAPYFVIVVLIVIFTQCEMAICFLIYLQTTTEFTTNIIRGVGVWGFYIGLCRNTWWACNKCTGGAPDKFAQQSTWFCYISGMLPASDKPITHKPTEHNINSLVTVQLAEKKPHALK